MFGLFKKKDKIKPVEITAENFKELVLESKQPVLLDFEIRRVQSSHDELECVEVPLGGDGILMCQTMEQEEPRHAG